MSLRHFYARVFGKRFDMLDFILHVFINACCDFKKVHYVFYSKA